MHIETLKDYEQKLASAVKEQKTVAKNYSEARSCAAVAKYSVDKALALKITAYRAEKKNLGIEMAILMKLEENDKEFDEQYRILLVNSALYKGYEKQLENLSSEIISVQSLMKWHKQGERFDPSGQDVPPSGYGGDGYAPF